jgi:hypothetical protein
MVIAYNTRLISQLCVCMKPSLFPVMMQLRTKHEMCPRFQVLRAVKISIVVSWAVT